MKLKDLLGKLPYKLLQGSLDAEVTGLAYDSREVKKGSGFIVLSGVKTEGAFYVEQAIRRGASVLFVEKFFETPISVTVVLLPDARAGLSALAAAFFGYPSEKLVMIGITGTKGKTTVSYMLKSILEKSGKRVGVIGTLGADFGDEVLPLKNTTPESLDLQRYLAMMAERGISHVVMEVSSQALKWKRTEDISFDYGIFTNFHRDHIGPGEHEDLQDYLDSKKKLFQKSKVSIVNRDDPVFKEIQKAARGSLITYGWDKTADMRAIALEYLLKRDFLGIRLKTEGLIESEFFVSGPGEFTGYNALAALSLSNALGIEKETAGCALSDFHVKGRMERVRLPGEGFHVFIDYAHNGSSMESLLTTLKAYMSANGNTSRIISLFGCGGNRSKDRRVQMGEVSGRLSGLSVITSDNIRYENVYDIINDILEGIKKTKGAYVVIPDRKEAIRFCLKEAKEGDIVLLLGKGHETYQEIKGVRYPFDERKIVRELYEKTEEPRMEEKQTLIIDGKRISAEIKEECRAEAETLKEQGATATLAVVLVGNDPASGVYVGNKKKACALVGIRSLSYELPEDTTEEELLSLIAELNGREDVDGILVQLPLPKHMDEEKVTLAIDPKKDVDGFHPMNVGALSIGRKGFVSCTPAGVIQLLKRSGVEIAGKECVVVGRSNIVGKPMAMLLLSENGTVTVAHSKTRDLKEVTKRADILVVAVGKPKFITKEYVKEGAVVIDVGIHRMENGKLCGDVDFDSVYDTVSAITPVPGGVGPMTIAMLMKNCIQAAGEK